MINLIFVFFFQENFVVQYFVKVCKLQKDLEDVEDCVEIVESVLNKVCSCVWVSVGGGGVGRQMLREVYRFLFFLYYRYYFYDMLFFLIFGIYLDNDFR